MDVHDWKIKSYMQLTAALQDYVDSGWTVYVLPWVVWLVQLTNALKFLKISKQIWATIIERTVCSSVEGLAYMHWILFSESNQHSTFDTDCQNAMVANQTKLLSIGRKSKLKNPKRCISQWSLSVSEMATTSRHSCKVDCKPVPWPEKLRLIATYANMTT
jgi:hypothetical protein